MTYALTFVGLLGVMVYLDLVLTVCLSPVDRRSKSYIIVHGNILTVTCSFFAVQLTD